MVGVLGGGGRGHDEEVDACGGVRMLLQDIVCSCVKPGKGFSIAKETSGLDCRESLSRCLGVYSRRMFRKVVVVKQKSFGKVDPRDPRPVRYHVMYIATYLQVWPASSSCASRPGRPRCLYLAAPLPLRALLFCGNGVRLQYQERMSARLWSPRRHDLGGSVWSSVWINKVRRRASCLSFASRRELHYRYKVCG